MGLADRHYMREGRRYGPLSTTVILMIVLVVVFALQCINDVYTQTFVERWLALTPQCFTRGYVWQLLTFQFLHGGLWHIICNLLGLWFLARFVETVLGSRRFLIAYLGCGVMGGILQGILMVLFPLHFGSAVYGASAGVSGMFAIFVRLSPGSEIRWNFIIPIRAEVLLWMTAGISLFFTLVPSARGGGVAHAAHLGGLLAGVAWVRLGWHRDFQPLPWDGAWRRLQQMFRRPPAGPRFTRRPAMRSAASTGVPREELDTDFISKDVDPILDKISAHGIQSLSERERKILEAARARMAKR